MLISEVVSVLTTAAPLPLQMDFDNAGVQVGDVSVPLTRALLTLDVTEAVVSEAIDKGCNLIVSHHPLLFHPLRHITTATYVERVVMQALRAGIVIVAMHTNIDAAIGGVNHKIAEKLGLTKVTFIGETKEVFGVIGGEGVMGELPVAMPSEDFLTMVKDVFGVPVVMTNGLLSRAIRRVAICGGAGASVLPIALAAGADAFVTGEMRYNEYFDHDDAIQIAVIGHYHSEQYTPEVFLSILTQAGIPALLSTVITNPIHYF